MAPHNPQGDVFPLSCRPQSPPAAPAYGPCPDNTLQDVPTRRKRMQGFAARWLLELTTYKPRTSAEGKL